MKIYKLLLKLSVFTSILMLFGCGQKGPLYLEDSSAKNSSGEVVEQPATNE
ncbi:MAG: lipoprotein [Pseudomonadales bacterium]|nr:lipoprotein [Pseudomonadales bacterium]MCJ8338329.1 lipoprotein [Pseudomonadales bacterium]